MRLNVITTPRYGFAPGSQPDVQLAYADWGSPNTPPEATIIAVHGITANLRGWDALAEKLVAFGFRFIAYDLRGRGDSSKPTTGYNLALHSFDLAALLDYFKLPQANIFGHSLGAAISVYFAAHFPDRTRRLVLLDGGALTPDDAKAAISRSLDRLGKTFPSLPEYLRLFRGSPYFPVWSENIENYYAYDARVNPDGTAMSKIPPAAIEEEWNNLMLTHQYLAVLHTIIKSPTLVLRATVGLLDDGKAGFILTEAACQKLLAAICQNAPAKLMDVANTNHFTIMFEAAPEMVQELNEFFR